MPAAARRGETESRSRDAATPGATHRTQCLERHNFERIPSCTDRDSRAAAHTPHAHWHIHKHPMQGFRHSLIISHIQCSADYGRSANHEYRRPRTVTAYRARSRTPVAPPHHATTRIYLSTPSRACAECADVHMRSLGGQYLRDEHALLGRRKIFETPRAASASRRPGHKPVADAVWCTQLDGDPSALARVGTVAVPRAQLG